MAKKETKAENSAKKKDSIVDLIDYVLSGSSLLYVITNDESSTVREIKKGIASMNLSTDMNNRSFGYYEWSCTDGLLQGTLQEIKKDDDNAIITNFTNYLDGKKENKFYVMEAKAEDPETRDPLRALSFFSNKTAGNRKHDFDCQVVVLKDIHTQLKDPRVVRRVKDLVIANDEPDCEVRKSMIIVSTIKNIPLEIQNYVNIIEWKLPTSEEIVDHLKTNDHIDEIVEDSSKFKGQAKSIFDYRTKYSKTEVEDMQKSLSGLSIPEIDNIVTFSQIRHKEIVPAFLMEQKKQLIMKNGLLEYHEPKIGMEEIGGMDLLKDWISIRKRAFSPEAKKFGIENPKGVLLVGIQGCGKSHMAKAIAHSLSVPLLRFDVGKVFSKTVGSSEENVRNVLSLIDAVGDCVVMIDEIEKGLAGVQSSNQSDGGTTARVVGTLLSWLNDKTSSAFIVATANDVKQLPPELQRKGRFDELFFVPLPEVVERKAIFEIHLNKRGRDASKFNTQAFAEISDKFSGAECEEAVRSALIIAFSDGEELEDRHVLRAIKELIPLFKTCEEDLTHLYNWVGWDEEKEDGIRARFASSARKKIAKSKGGNVISFKKTSKETSKEKE